MERTEEQKIIQAPVIVVLGGKEYQVKPLVIKESRAWRQAVVKAITALPPSAPEELAKPAEGVSPGAMLQQKMVELSRVLDNLLVAQPDTVIDLFFRYARDLDREEIEAVATDDEMARAFVQIVEVAFPLARSLARTVGVLAR